MDRRALLLSGLGKTDKVMEIGASYNPLVPKAEGWNVFIADHDTRDGLLEKYGDHPGASRIEEVDYVWSDGDLSEAIPADQHGTFDAFIASHVIEHTTDVVSFLRSAQTVVSAGGAIILAVPDKRKCFDFYRPVSTTGDAIAAHRERRTRHNAKTQFDASVFCVSKGGHGWPIDDLRAPHLEHDFGAALDTLDLANSSEYVDAHNWIFTPASFELMILELAALGFLDMRVEFVAEAPAVEFHARLRKGRAHLSAEALKARRIELMNRTIMELAEQCRQIPGSRYLRMEQALNKRVVLPRFLSRIIRNFLPRHRRSFA
ncbi:hypothetical protein GCM10007301_38370 [Azorhizobium oxalatiphilum]|uniref:Methyltransferase type 11 domain-containing protein n=1 Tax=Azorhizobium oxalatiphilum TaxID=980631 RepID=A0A917C6S9_9HYPH|nr:methyltransferase domain-containing protein [Azorhizobium oxalatiphilum]GGF74831.1 hypothetical protein GCM10007301_38370 [Azorhizobium oxalatiphilum]